MEGPAPRAHVGRRVVVTGGASGIGLATARRFIGEGARVVVLDRDAAALERARAELPGLAGAVRADVSQPDEVEAAFGETDGLLGGVDILIANAGISVRNRFLDIEPEQWSHVIGVNLTGAFLCSKYASPHLAKTNGSIINIASTRGLTLDYTFKRATEAIHASDGTQGPREIFPGALEVDFKLKAIFENDNDLTTFLTGTQPAFVATVTSPVGATGTGSVLTLTGSQASYTKASTSRDGTYAVIDIDGSAVFNATDAGVVKPTLTNYVATAY